MANRSAWGPLMSKSSFRMEKTQFDEKAISYKLSFSFFFLGGGDKTHTCKVMEMGICKEKQLTQGELIVTHIIFLFLFFWVKNSHKLKHIKTNS